MLFLWADSPSQGHQTKGRKVTCYELAREIDRLVRARIAANNGKSRDEVMRAHEQAERHVAFIGDALATMDEQAAELMSLRDNLVRDAEERTRRETEDLKRASLEAEKHMRPPTHTPAAETTLPPIEDDIPF
jgi:hypothetical protein